MAKSIDTGLFDRVVVFPTFNYGSSVSVYLNERKLASVPGPYTFYLEWAEHVNADFVQVGDGTDLTVLYDDDNRVFSKLPHSVYRVRLETDTVISYSEPANITGNWNRHDYLIAREVVRREYVAMQRYTGTRGFYLARKVWGEICSACADYNTQEPTNSHCETCFGTGFVGGYNNADVFYLVEDRTGGREERQDSVGVVTNKTQTARAIAYPYITSKDIWISAESDKRWSIEGQNELVAMRGIPIVYGLQLRLIEPGNIIYSVPV